METADVRRRVHEAMERAKRNAAERRARHDHADRAFAAFLDHTAVPLMRQVAGALKADGYPFTVSTPAGSVRLSSDKNGADFVEISLDASGDTPHVAGHSSRTRGRRVIEAERMVAGGDPETISEDELLAFVLKELEPLLER